MVDVDDEIADLEIAQIRKERLRRRAAALRRAPLFLEDVGFGVDLQAGVRQPEPARQVADRDEHRGIARVFGALDRDGEDVVLLQQLDRPLGAARRRRDEQRGLAGVAEPPDLGDPVGDAAVQLDRRLAADVTARRRSSLGCRIGECRRVVVEAELRQLGRGGEPGARRRRRCGERLARRGGSALCGLQRLVVAVLNLLEQLRAVRVDFVALGHDDARRRCARAR